MAEPIRPTARFRPYSYWALVRDSEAVTQQLATCMCAIMRSQVSIRIMAD